MPFVCSSKHLRAFGGVAAILSLVRCSSAPPPGVGSGTEPTEIEPVDGNQWELERRAALAGCTATVSNSRGVHTRIYYDASGWPLQHDYYANLELPLRRLRTTYEHVDGRVISSEMTTERYNTPSYEEWAYNKYGCDQWAPTLTAITYNDAQRPASQVDTRENACGAMLETAYTYDYTINTDVLTAATQTREDGVVSGVWTYDACAMVLNYNNASYEVSYRDGCDVDVVSNPSDPLQVHWENLRPAYSTSREGDLQDTYVYEGCGAQDATLPTTEFETRPDPVIETTPTDPSLDPRTGWAYAVHLEDGQWSPSWIGDVLEDAMPSGPLVLSVVEVTPNTLSLLLEEDTEIACRTQVALPANTWDDPSFVAASDPALWFVLVDEVVQGDGQAFMVVGDSALERPAISVSGTLPDDGVAMQLTMIMYAHVDTMDWLGLGDADAICAQAELEGQPCVPCGTIEGMCLELTTTLEASRTDAPVSEYDC